LSGQSGAGDKRLKKRRFLRYLGILANLCNSMSALRFDDVALPVLRSDFIGLMSRS
jgi:hypothetical protein